MPRPLAAPPAQVPIASPPARATNSWPPAMNTGAAKSSTGCTRGARIRPPTPAATPARVDAAIACSFRSLAATAQTTTTASPPARARSASDSKTIAGIVEVRASFHGWSGNGPVSRMRPEARTSTTTLQPSVSIATGIGEASANRSSRWLRSASTRPPGGRSERGDRGVDHSSHHHRDDERHREADREGRVARAQGDTDRRARDAPGGDHRSRREGQDETADGDAEDEGAVYRLVASIMAWKEAGVGRGDSGSPKDTGRASERLHVRPRPSYSVVMLIVTGTIGIDTIHGPTGSAMRHGRLCRLLRMPPRATSRRSDSSAWLARTGRTTSRDALLVSRHRPGRSGDPVGRRDLPLGWSVARRT